MKNKLDLKNLFYNVALKSECFILHKKLTFPLRISSVNVTTFAVFYGFGHIN